MTRRLLLAALFGLALASVGCGPNAKKIADEYRPTAEPRLAQLDKILDDCRKRPVATESSLPKGQSNLHAATSAGASGNVRVIWLQAHDDTAKFIPSSAHEYDTELGDWWRAPQQALAGQWAVKTSDDAALLVKHFESLRDAEYVLVVNTPKIDMPQHDHDDWYKPGWAEGCVHLYRLADGSYLGGAPFAGPARDTSFAGMDFTLTSKNPAENVEHLRRQLYRNLHEQAGRRLTTLSARP